MKTITIFYNRRKHNTDEYEERIISAFQSLGFEYDGSDMDMNMTRGLFFIVPADKHDIDIEVNTFDENEE